MPTEAAAELRLLRSVPSAPFLRPDVPVTEPRPGQWSESFKWGFISADTSGPTRTAKKSKSRLDGLAARHGLQGAIVRFGPDRLDVEVPHRLQAEQIIALQEWLDSERETLDVSQVP